MSTFKVDDMSCGHCVASIEKAVSAADPAASADCDLGAKTVEITGAQDLDRVLSAIRAAGYEPVPA